MKGHAQFTEVDLIDYFSKHDKYHTEQDSDIQNFQPIFQCGKKLSKESENKLEKVLNEYILSKNYLKIELGKIIKSMNLNSAKVVKIKLSSKN